MKTYPFFRQLDSMDCGPSCLRMVAAWYGRRLPLADLREMCYANRNGVTLLGICDAAENIGFRSIGIKTTFERLRRHVILPCIVHWRQDHFVVVYKMKVRGKGNRIKGYVLVADPAFGLVKYNVTQFLEGWLADRMKGEDKGTVLMLSPTMKFYHGEDGVGNGKRYCLSHFFSYIRLHSRMLIQVMLGMLIGLLIQLIFPFLTQSMVDVGILNNDLNFIILVLVAQMVLSLSQMAVGFIQSWILLHVTVRINIALIADFITKMLRLPISFFEMKKTGDILQRIGDHGRIQNFFTATSIGTLFSFFNFFVFAIILGYYNLYMLLFFILGHALYVGWVMLFLRIRRELDFRRFDRAARNQSSVIQIITAAEEIKLNGCEQKMRWKWEGIQAELFDVSVKGLSVSQIQSVGAFFITTVVNSGLSVYAAYLVVHGNITLGMMMSLTYILGQLKGPVSSFIGFVHSYQDARSSLERLGEVHFREDENKMNENRLTELPGGEKGIHIRNLTFSYLGPLAQPVLKDVNLDIESGKVTAIVGESGSGKTTLLKLLLGYYDLQQGSVSIGHVNLKNINTYVWRKYCGAVMQDGFIFSDSIAENIAVKDERIDKQRLLYAAKMANVQEFAEEQCAGYNTKIGQEGSGLSQGQKQRVLIARAIYRDPDYLFFDEATNSLDANNERMIWENLGEFFKGRTVVVVAHRLSTVKNADKIVVLDKGKVVEEGTHRELAGKQGYYYNLVKNQLEL